MAMMDLFKTIIIVQLFFSFGVTLTSYALEGTLDTYRYIPFSDTANTIDMEGIKGDLEEGVTNQLGIPVIEMGALLFYSGNIIVDLLLNFAFAIPEMIGLLVFGFTEIFSIDSVIIGTLEMLTGVFIGVLYFIGIIQLLLGIRSGRSVV